jgi:hypothetical protein
MGDGHINLLDLGDERFRFSGRKVAAEIAGKTLFKIFRFTLGLLQMRKGSTLARK